MWEPRRLTTLRASTSFYRDSLTFIIIIIIIIIIICKFFVCYFFLRFHANFVIGLWAFKLTRK
jgi:hypothetical protein